MHGSLSILSRGYSMCRCIDYHRPSCLISCAPQGCSLSDCKRLPMHLFLLLSTRKWWSSFARLLHRISTRAVPRCESTFPTKQHGTAGWHLTLPALTNMPVIVGLGRVQKQQVKPKGHLEGLNGAFCWTVSFAWDFEGNTLLSLWWPKH